PAAKKRSASPKIGPSIDPSRNPAAALIASPTFFAQLNPMPQKTQAKISRTVGRCARLLPGVAEMGLSVIVGRPKQEFQQGTIGGLMEDKHVVAGQKPRA